ncbi:MAG: hypothetical protein IPP01_14055 [Saprospiraceae bacterium]|nr:hypothetical protein [Saprospiraceae bacterium]
MQTIPIQGAYVTANPTSPLALADCDNGGISNIIECQNGGDPLNPSDDCDVINSGVVDICDTLAVNPTSPLANVDCDGDGQTNTVECTNNTDPGDPWQYLHISTNLYLCYSKSNKPIGIGGLR